MLRRIAPVVAAAAALVVAGIGVAPAEAEVVRPNTVPTALLTGATITFTTTTDNKDDDSQWTIEVLTNKDTVAAETGGESGEFPEGSVRGPFPLTVNPGVTAADLNPGLAGMFFDPNGHDTWRFTYSLAMTFSDGSSAVFAENGKVLSETLTQFQTPFNENGLPGQVPVPNVVGLDNIGASGVLESAGLHATTLGTTLDTLCEHNERDVASQSPGAGTVVATGSLVGLRLWTEPKSCP